MWLDLNVKKEEEKGQDCFSQGTMSPVVQCKDTMGMWEEGEGVSNDWSVMGGRERAGLDRSRDTEIDSNRGVQ